MKEHVSKQLPEVSRNRKTSSKTKTTRPVRDLFAGDSAEILRLILENTRAGIIVANSDGKIIIMNPLARKQLQPKPKSGEKVKNLRDLLRSKDATRIIDIIHEVILVQKNFYDELVLVMGRRCHWFEVTIATSTWLLRNQSSGPCVIILMREITEHKHAEQALQRSEKRYRAVVEAQTELISRWLPDFTRSFVNKAYCRYMGKTREELLNKSILSLMPPKERKKFRRQIAHLTRHKPILTHEKPIIMPDGQSRWQQWNERAIFDDSGQLVEFQSVGRDITERKKMELDLKHSKKALHNQKGSLEQKNIALREILEQVGVEKKMIKDDILSNIEHLLLPILEKIRSDPAYTVHPQIDLLEKNIRGLASSFGKKISQASLKLTPREIEICNMIQHGLSNKEMAEISHISVHTIETHRDNIRYKFNLKKKKINLATFLQSI